VDSSGNPLTGVSAVLDLYDTNGTHAIAAQALTYMAGGYYAAVLASTAIGVGMAYTGAITTSDSRVAVQTIPVMLVLGQNGNVDLLKVSNDGLTITRTAKLDYLSGDTYAYLNTNWPASLALALSIASTTITGWFTNGINLTTAAIANIAKVIPTPPSTTAVWRAAQRLLTTAPATPTDVATQLTNYGTAKTTDVTTSQGVITSAITSSQTAINTHTDTDTAGLATTIVVNAIKAKTDNLPASPAATTDIPMSSIASIKAKTDLLPSVPAAQSDVTGAVTSINAHTDTDTAGLATPTSVGSQLLSYGASKVSDITTSQGVITDAITSAQTAINTHTDTDTAGLASQTSVNSITTNVARGRTVVPQQIEYPASGTAVYEFDLLLYNLQGALDTPDALPTIHTRNSAGVSMDSGLSSTTMTQISVGRYSVFYTLDSTATVQEMLIDYSWAVGGINFHASDSTSIVYKIITNFTTDDRTTLQGIAAVLPTTVVAAKADIPSLSGIATSLNVSDAQSAIIAAQPSITALATSEDIIDAQVAIIGALPDAPNNAGITSILGVLPATIIATQSDIAAVKAKTDNLPESPAAVDSEMTLTGAYDSAKTAAQAGNEMRRTTEAISAIGVAIPPPDVSSLPTKTDLANSVISIETVVNGHTDNAIGNIDFTTLPSKNDITTAANTVITDVNSNMNTAISTLSTSIAEAYPKTLYRNMVQMIPINMGSDNLDVSITIKKDGGNSIVIPSSQIRASSQTGWYIYTTTAQDTDASYLLLTATAPSTPPFVAIYAVINEMTAALSALELTVDSLVDVVTRLASEQDYVEIGERGCNG